MRPSGSNLVREILDQMTRKAGQPNWKLVCPSAQGGNAGGAMTARIYGAGAQRTAGSAFGGFPGSATIVATAGRLAEGNE